MKTAMSFKIDKDVRDSARKAAKIVGLPLSTVVNNILTDFIRDERTVFQSAKSRERRKKLAHEFAKVIGDVRTNHRMSSQFDNAQKMNEFLNAIKN